MSNVLEDLFGGGDAAAATVAAGTVPAASPQAGGAGQEEVIQAQLLAELSEPEEYRPYLLRARAQLSLAVIEADGTGHGFYYHEVRHPKHQRRDGKEFLTFTAGPFAVAMQGNGLRLLWAAMLRATLAEVREHDGRTPLRPTLPTVIEKLAVVDVRQMETADRAELLG